jgi:hypothetical protein
MDNLDWAQQQYEEMILTGDPELDIMDAEEEEQWQKDAPYDKECKHCNTGNLKWLSIGDKWRLYDEYNNVHICEKYPQPPKQKPPTKAELKRLELWRIHEEAEPDNFPF